MSIDEKEIQEHEDKYKKVIYDRIGEVISRVSEISVNSEAIGRILGIDCSIPNIGITLNNKLNEIVNEFKRAGISMFTEAKEKYGFVGSNSVGDAIIDDMISRVSDSIQALEKYNSSLKLATNKRKQRITASEKTGSVKKLFLKIRSLFVHKNIAEEANFLPEEIKDIQSCLDAYKGINENLWHYNLRENVGQSIVKSLSDKQYSISTTQEILKEDVEPTLRKLGLEDLLPQIKDDLSKENMQEHSKDKKTWELSASQKISILASSEKVVDNYRENETTKEDIEHDK